MRLILAILFTCLFGAIAHAQLSWGQIVEGAINKCIADRPGQPNAPAFCDCWVHRFIGLWNADDIASWRTGVATKHMGDMESAAAAQCGG